MALLERKPRAYTPDTLHEKFNDYFKYMKTQTWTKYEAIKSGEMAGELIAIPTNTPLSRKGFCVFAGINEQTLRNYASGLTPYEDYFDLCMRALDIIDNNQLEGAMVGAYNPNIVARIQGLIDNKDITTNGKDINEIPTINVLVNSNKIDFAHSEDEIDES